MNKKVRKLEALTQYTSPGPGDYLYPKRSFSKKDFGVTVAKSKRPDR